MITYGLVDLKATDKEECCKIANEMKHSFPKDTFLQKGMLEEENANWHLSYHFDATANISPQDILQRLKDILEEEYIHSPMIQYTISYKELDNQLFIHHKKLEVRIENGVVHEKMVDYGTSPLHRSLYPILFYDENDE